MTQTQPDSFLRFDEVRPLLKADRPIKWLFTGDSITHGALHTLVSASCSARPGGRLSPQTNAATLSSSPIP